MGNKGEVPLVTQSAKGGDEPFPLFKVAKGRKLNGKTYNSNEKKRLDQVTPGEKAS